MTTTTMELAARELREGAPHGTLVMAEEMTNGRGRTKQCLAVFRLSFGFFCVFFRTCTSGSSAGKWISPKDGNLYITLVLRAAGIPGWNGHRRSQANFAAPLAVAMAIKDVAPDLHPMIRRPPAVEIDGRKVSGSLIEGHGEDGLEHLALGVGVNVNASFCENSTFSQDVTSLKFVA